MLHFKPLRTARPAGRRHAFIDSEVHFFLVLAVWFMAVFALVLALCLPVFGFW